MEYRRVGKSGLKVSEIAYGSWLTFANQIELDNARKIIRRAFELGINYIDTADVYAKGAAETLLGEILLRVQQKPLCRGHKSILAHVRYHHRPGAEPQACNGLCPRQPGEAQTGLC